jgi:hypothetical protein
MLSNAGAAAADMLEGDMKAMARNDVTTIGKLISRERQKGKRR